MITNKIKLRSFFFLIPFLLSCDINTEPGNAINESSVIFNLVANKKVQQLYLYRTAELGEDTRIYADSLNYFKESYGQFFIKDANIQIESDDLHYNNFSILKDEYSAPDKGYQYINSDSLTILPNTKYLLSINYSSKNIFGETTLPDNFKIISPENDTIMKAANGEKNISFRTTWSKSNNAKGYIITIVKTSVEYLSSTSYITTDTTFLINKDMGWGNYRLEILAYDKNFHNYIIEEYYQSGLENAYGYFGSSVLESIDFEIQY